jgi:WD40 repeat protein
LALFRGTSNKLLNSLLANSLETFDESLLANKRYPQVSITLDHVYGFEAYDRRNTLAYVEQYDSDWIASKDLIPPYDKPAESGSLKHYVHFISRVAVVTDSASMKQKFYEGHTSKISCMAVHPSKRMVATGECSECPQIHIWRIQTCEPRAVIQTNHNGGIMNMAFSYCGSLIVSVGVDELFSLQVTDWAMEEIIAFRNTSKEPIIDVVVHPRDKYEFATCGDRLVQIWGISGKSIILKENVHMMIGDKNELPCITCIKYMYYMLQGEVQSDLIVGTNLGDLGLVSKGKYIVTKRIAHKKMINCIRISDFFRDVKLG